MVDVAGGSITDVDGATGVSADTSQPEIRLSKELVLERVPECELLDEAVPLESVLLRDPLVPRDEIVDCDNDSTVGIGGVDTNVEASSVSLHNARYCCIIIVSSCSR